MLLHVFSVLHSPSPSPPSLPIFCSWKDKKLIIFSANTKQSPKVRKTFFLDIGMVYIFPIEWHILPVNQIRQICIFNFQKGLNLAFPPSPVEFYFLFVANYGEKRGGLLYFFHKSTWCIFSFIVFLFHPRFIS